MKKVVYCVAVALAAIAFSSQSQAGFTSSGPGSVIELGTFTVGTTTVNKFDDNGELVVSESSWNHPADFTSTMAAGTYRVALVSAQSGSFSVDSDTAVAGVVASNGWRPAGAPASTFTNVWGSLFPDALTNAALYAAIENVIGAANLTGLVDNSGRGIEITSAASGGGTGNPDEITLAGNQLTYNVNSGISGGFGQEYSLVFAVPEPASLAIWAACGLGCVVAARRRKRAQIA